MRPVARAALVGLLGIVVAWAFVGWTAPKSVLTFVAAVSLCR